MKEKHLKLILQEILRHKGTGDVFNRIIRSAGVVRNETTDFQTVDSSVDGTCIRMTMADRTGISVINRFEPDTLNIRLERMKNAMARQNAHTPFSYPGARSGCSHDAGEKPEDAAAFHSDGQKITAAVINGISTRFKRPVHIECRVEQVYSVRHLINTSGFDARDERLIYRIRTVIRSEIHGMPVAWAATIHRDSIPSDAPLRMMSSLPEYWGDPVGAPGRLSGQRTAIMDSRAVRQWISSLLPWLHGDVSSQQQPFWLTGDSPFAAGIINLLAGSVVPSQMANFDDEGSVTGMKPLVKDRRLQSSLNDLRSAAGTGRTAGHCVRDPQLTPGPGWTSARLETGSHSLPDLLNIPGNHLLILQLHHPRIDPADGYFSSGYSGRLLKNGEPGPWIHSGTLAGPLTGLLNAVDAVGTDTTTDQGITCPAIRLRDIMLL
ncbi:MAG TPA: metallopeptidase TldD-related protein [bacterium]|nr:metallopeptidase TldD-related protein [bacterium]